MLISRNQASSPQIELKSCPQKAVAVGRRLGRKDMTRPWSSLEFPTCEADRALEGTSHPFEAVLYQMALEFGGGVKGLAAEFAFVVQSFIC